MKNDVKQYISSFPKEVQTALEQVRAAIRNVVPEAEESISYAMPTITWKQQPVLYFAGFKHHIGCYPAPVAVKAFQKDLAAYATGKGSVQFPVDEPMPVVLIQRMATHRLQTIKKNLRTPSLRTCKRGHRFYKSSNCPTCPKCARERLAHDDFMPQLSAPARRALAGAGIRSLKALSRMSQKEVLALHGIGKAALPILVAALSGAGMTFKMK